MRHAAKWVFVSEMGKCQGDANFETPRWLSKYG